MSFFVNIPPIIWNMVLTCGLFFVFGITVGWSTASQVQILDFISKFGNFLAAISALLAVTLAIAHKEYLRLKKIEGLKNICQIELENYSDQIQDFFLFFLFNDGFFIKNPDEWVLLKPKFPDTPNVFTNYDLLLDLEIDFVKNIGDLISNRNKILKIIRKIDDLFSSKGGLYDEDLKNILSQATFLKEHFCVSYNKISSSNGFCLPQTSMFHILMEQHS